MDFVVVGLGVGALAVLLGLTIRDAGARWWSLPADQAMPAAEIERRLMIGRAGRAGGLVLGAAGGTLILATLIALLLGLSDRVGAIVVMAAISVAVLGGVAWGIVYSQRHHPRPISRGARRRRLATEAQPDAVPSLAEMIDAGTGGVIEPADEGEGEHVARSTGPADDQEDTPEAAGEPAMAAGLAVADEAGSGTRPAPILGPPLPAIEPGPADPASPAGDDGEVGSGPATGLAGASPDADNADEDEPVIAPPAGAEREPLPDPDYAASGQERRR